jgi:DNA-binding Lrp family transcriptional regulator
MNDVRQPGSASSRPPEQPSDGARSRPWHPADAIDRAILLALAGDARIPNNALAERVGIAPSTCLARVRALRESGAIRGYHADIDPTALGFPLQAMIAVRLQTTARDQLRAFTDRIRTLPQVRSIYFLAGADDFLVHVVAPDAGALRDFVLDQLSAHHEVALTETKLIFDHVWGAVLPG